MTTYCPDYKPHDAEKFSQMTKMLGMAADPRSLSQLMMLFVMDMTYHREDILVVVGRVERQNGWKL